MRHPPPLPADDDNNARGLRDRADPVAPDGGGDVREADPSPPLLVTRGWIWPPPLSSNAVGPAGSGGVAQRRWRRGLAQAGRGLSFFFLHGLVHVGEDIARRYRHFLAAVSDFYAGTGFDL